MLIEITVFARAYLCALALKHSNSKKNIRQEEV